MNEKVFVDTTPEMIATLKKRFKLPEDEFKIMGRVGTGSEGDVAWAQHIPSGRMNVAIKKLEEIFLDRNHAKRLAR